MKIKKGVKMGMSTEQQTIKVELPQQDTMVTQISVSVIAGLILAIILVIVKRKGKK